MADPFTMAVGGTVASAAGSLLGASSASAKAESEAKNFQYKAALARQNAAINRQNSDWTLDAGEYNAAREGMSTRFTIGKQKVAQAAGGFDVNSGSYEDVRDSTQKVGLMDQDQIRLQAARKAQGYRSQADVNDLEATADDIAASNAQKAGKTNVFSTLLGGVSGVADKWLKAGSSFSGASTGITTYGSNFEVTGFTPT